MAVKSKKVNTTENMELRAEHLYSIQATNAVILQPLNHSETRQNTPETGHKNSQRNDQFSGMGQDPSTSHTVAP